MAHVAYNTVKSFLAPRLGEDVMNTIDRTCDTTKGCTLTRSKSYEGTEDVVTALFETKTGNELEIEFDFRLKGE